MMADNWWVAKEDIQPVDQSKNLRLISMGQQNEPD